MSQEDFEQNANQDIINDYNTIQSDVHNKSALGHPSLRQPEINSQLNSIRNRNKSMNSTINGEIVNEDTVMFYVIKRKQVQEDVKHYKKLKTKSKEFRKHETIVEERYNEKRQKQSEIQHKRIQTHAERVKEANSLRINRMRNDAKAKEFINELRMKKNAQKEMIKTQQKQAAFKLENLKQKQIFNTKKNIKNTVMDEKDLIRKREIEAQKLEKLEAKLLNSLQQTQNMEKEAFTQLEKAMNDVSKPKRDRVTQSRLSKKSEERR